MKVVSKDEMEWIDKEASLGFGIPSSILMENAGIAISDKILELYPNISSLSILVGPGNNGGDGLVIARYFFTRGFLVNIYMLCKEDKLKDDALVNFVIAKKLNIPLNFITTTKEWSVFNKKIFASLYLIDAILGTGLNSELRDFYKEVITELNLNYKNNIIAVDTPSGLLHLRNRQNKVVLRATHTITVGLPKIGMFYKDYPFYDFVGKLHIVDIGFPPSLLKSQKIKGNLITRSLAKKTMPTRPYNGHKGVFGHTLVIAGSKLYRGAGILTAISALRTGCGLVSLASTPSICKAFQIVFPEGISIELNETNDGFICDSSKEILAGSLSSYSAIVFGPGIGISSSGFNLLSFILNNYSGNLLLDADGINLLSFEDDTTRDNLNKELLKKSHANIVLTPHIKELARFLCIDSSSLIEKKLDIGQALSLEYGINIILKSAVSIIFALDGSFYFNTTGNHGMASGGSGDVLSGIVASFMAQGLSALDSSIIGVYLHGLAGDIAKEKEHAAFMSAQSIIKYIKNAFRLLEE